MSGYQKHLYKRNNIYYCRVIVPIELREILGRNEFWQSLQTPLYPEAKKYVIISALKFYEYFEKVRNIKRMRKELIPQDIPIIADNYFKLLLNADLNQRRFWTERGQFNIYQEGELGRQETADKLAKHLAEGNYNEWEEVADKRLDAMNIQLKKESSLYKNLCIALMQAKLKGLKAIQARSAGNWDDGVTYGSGTNYVDLLGLDNLESITLEELINKFNGSPEINQKSDEVKAKYKNYQRAILDLIGKEIQI